MIRTKQPRIEDALSVVDREIGIVTAERTAFSRFLAYLRNVEVDRRTASGTRTRVGGQTSALVVRDGVPDETMREIQTAYRDTVMDVPHYDAEYGDSLFESLAKEIGIELATYVRDGNTLTPVVYDTLVEAVERAKDERMRFLRALRREQESLRNIESELNDLEAGAVEFGERSSDGPSSRSVSATDEKLRRIEGRCTDLVIRRQRVIHNRSVASLSGINRESLIGYLYADRETTCPALADAVDCLATIRHYRDRRRQRLSGESPRT